MAGIEERAGGTGNLNNKKEKRHDSTIRVPLFGMKLYFGQGIAECGRVLSSGKLNAPSIALEVGPISNHCNNGIT